MTDSGIKPGIQKISLKGINNPLAYRIFKRRKERKIACFFAQEKRQ
ncbi:hypothetical protein [Labilibaculum sp.]